MYFPYIHQFAKKSALKEGDSILFAVTANMTKLPAVEHGIVIMRHDDIILVSREDNNREKGYAWYYMDEIILFGGGKQPDQRRTHLNFAYGL